MTYIVPARRNVLKTFGRGGNQLERPPKKKKGKFVFLNL